MLYSIPFTPKVADLSRQQRQQLLEKNPLSSLFEIFSTIHDPRSKHGKRYSLPFLLTCFVGALLCNRNSTLAVSQWCHDHQPLLVELFGPLRFLCPSDSLYRKLLPHLNAEQIEYVLSDWIRSTLVATLHDPIALDGKRVRGAKNEEGVAPHLLSFRTHRSHETLFQVAVSDKTNEIPVAQALLPQLPLAGRVITADALHTQKAFFIGVEKQGGKALLTVKMNQPQLYTDLSQYFADPLLSSAQAWTTQRQRGRKEIRSLRVSTEMNSYLKEWPHVGQVAELTRTVTRTKTGETSKEVVYLITHLSPQDANPLLLLEYIRGHWSIENSSHYVRDVTFQEDRSQLRTGHAPQIVAAFRNLVITLIHRQGSSHIAATRRHFSAHPLEAFQLLLPGKGGTQ
jgi:predicted transposase YbfD/YdcC